MFVVSAYLITPLTERGYAISSGSAFAFDIQNSHGRAMFDMALLARQHNLTIEVHAREVEQGYLLADRIWVK